MVSSCCAFGCTNRFVKNGIGFFHIPKKPVRRKLWILALRRKNFEPSRRSVVCGEHFQTGRPSKDPNHPDYVPNIFNLKPSKRSGPKLKIINKDERKENGANHFSTEKNISLKTFSSCNSSQIEEPPEPAEGVINIEAFLQQELTEMSVIKQEIEVVENNDDLQLKLNKAYSDISTLKAEKDALVQELTAARLAHSSEVSEKDDELLNLKLELNEAFSDISILKAEKDALLQELTAAYETQKFLYSSASVKEAELLKQRKELKQAYEEMNALRKEKDVFQKQLANSDLTSILQDSSKLNFYTGLTSMKDFNLILTLLSNVQFNVTSISKEKQLLMVLMRLKLNLMHSDLAYRFQTSKSTVCRIWDCIIFPLRIKLDLLVKCPVNNALKKNIPVNFKNTVYENLYQRLQRHFKSKGNNEDTD